MRLEGLGQPLHTRALSITLAARADGKLDVDGAIVDLRKRGLVPVAGDLQGCGIIHDMRLAGVVDPANAVLETIVAEQRSIAFEACAATGGESCRDPAGRIAALAGSRLDASWSRRLGQEIGGPRGCSHLLTLGHVLGSATARALERERALYPTPPSRYPGQRVWKRDLVIDGHEPAEGRLQLAAQLNDVHFAPAPALARPMERFAEDLGVQVLAELDLATMTLGHTRAAERRRTAADLAAAWAPRDDRTAWMAGARLTGGITGELFTRLGANAEDRPLLDALLMLAPALVQCMAALSDVWLASAQANPTLVGMGGMVDSCYMWRSGGALQRAREADGGWQPRRP
jgi:hypothetical protein